MDVHFFHFFVVWARRDHHIKVNNPFVTICTIHTTCIILQLFWSKFETVLRPLKTKYNNWGNIGSNNGF